MQSNIRRFIKNIPLPRYMTVFMLRDVLVMPEAYIGGDIKRHIFGFWKRALLYQYSDDYTFHLLTYQNPACISPF